MGFKKPPVVEAWIEFRFALTQEKSIWDESAAVDLVKSHFEDFKPESFSKYVRIEVDAKTGKPNLTGVQELFDRVRAFTDGRDLCVQAGRDVLVLNQLNKGEWPGYEPMRDAAIKAAKKYMEFREFDEPVVVAVGLHYRDVVSLPRCPGSGIKLEEWFRIYPEVPEGDFGAMSGFKFSVHLPTMCEGANVVLTTQSLPIDPGNDSELRFAIDWHVSSADRIEGVDRARQWLDSVHKGLRSSFDKAFTPECLALFEPSKGE